MHPATWLNGDRWNDEAAPKTTALTVHNGNHSNGLTFAERNAQIRNDMFRQMTMQKLQEQGR